MVVLLKKKKKKEANDHGEGWFLTRSCIKSQTLRCMKKSQVPGREGSARQSGNGVVSSIKAKLPTTKSFSFSPNVAMYAKPGLLTVEANWRSEECKIMLRENLACGLCRVCSYNHY